MSSLTIDTAVQAVPVQTARLRAAQDEGPAVKAILIGIALLFFVLFLLLPLILVFMTAFGRGIMPYLSALSQSDTWHAASLTVLVAVIAVPLNIAFGLAASWAIARFEFRGKSLLTTLIDLPFSVSPVIAGLMFLLIFGRQGPVLGLAGCQQHSYRLCFARFGPGDLVCHFSLRGARVDSTDANAGQ
jgi:sulfate transport system permease protein